MAKPSRVIVLVEDERHRNFVYRYLRRLDYSHHEIYVEDLPAGRGCGEQWVREKYAKNVAAYRARAAHAKTGLIVMIDADNGNVWRRINQLAGALAEVNMPARDGQERIAHLIPRRNIETWVLCLTGTEVDEVTDYHNAAEINELIRPAALVFYDWTRSNAQVPVRCVHSLQIATVEAKRLEA